MRIMLVVLTTITGQSEKVYSVSALRCFAVVYKFCVYWHITTKHAVQLILYSCLTSGLSRFSTTLRLYGHSYCTKRLIKLLASIRLEIVCIKKFFLSLQCIIQSYLNTTLIISLGLYDKGIAKNDFNGSSPPNLSGSKILRLKTHKTFSLGILQLLQYMHTVGSPKNHTNSGSLTVKLSSILVHHMSIVHIKFDGELILGLIMS